VRVFDRIASNAVVLIAWRTVQRLLSFVLLWFLVRWLSPESFGLYSFIFTWVVTVTAFTDLGGSTIGIRLWAEDPARAARSMPVLYRIRVIAIGIGLAISVMVWLLIYGRLPSWGLVLIALGLFAGLQAVAWAPFQAALRNNAPSSWAAFNRLLVIAVVIAALLFKAPLWFVIGLEIGLGFLFVVRLIRGAGRISAERIAGDTTHRNPWTARELLLEMLPLGIANALVMAFFRADVFMLMRMAGERTVAEYAAGFRLVEPLLTFTGVMGSSLFPIIISRHAGGDLSGAFRSIGRSARLLPFVMTLCALALYMNANTIVLLLFGPTYAASAATIRWLAWTLPLSAWSYSWHPLVLAERRYGYNILMSALALTGNICGNLWAIPRYGAVGAAAMTVATESIWAFGTSLPAFGRAPGARRILATQIATAVLVIPSASALMSLSSSLVFAAAATVALAGVVTVCARLTGLVTRDDLDGVIRYLSSLRAIESRPHS
jgi:O-antigen/teichoic acid export membrane protein